MLLGLSGALGGALAFTSSPAPSAVGPAHRAPRRQWTSRGGAPWPVRPPPPPDALVLLVTQLVASAAAGRRRCCGTLRAALGRCASSACWCCSVRRSPGRGSPGPRPGGPPLGAGPPSPASATALLGHSGTGRSRPHPGPRVSGPPRRGGDLGGLPVRPRPGARAARARAAAARDAGAAVLQRFGPPAAVCVAVLVVTGVYLQQRGGRSVDAAISTFYGRTLLLKVALAAVAGALALVNTVRLRRGSLALHAAPHRRWPRRPAAVGVLALAAVLTSGQPAMEPQLVQSTTRAADGLVDRKVADLQEAVSVRPTGPGPTSSWSTCSTHVDRPLAGAGGGRVAEPAGRSERRAAAGRAARRRSLVGQHHPGGGGRRHRARRRAARRPARHHGHVRLDRGRRTAADPPGRRLHGPAGAGPARGRGVAAARAARRRRAGAGGPAPRSAGSRPAWPAPGAGPRAGWVPAGSGPPPGSGGDGEPESDADDAQGSPRGVDLGGRRRRRVGRPSAGVDMLSLSEDLPMLRVVWLWVLAPRYAVRRAR